MIQCKTPAEVEIMDRCNRVVLTVLEELRELVEPGVTLLSLDEHAERRCREMGARPAFKGYRDFPRSICASVNEEVVHGIPGRRQLMEGDIVGIDFGVVMEGFFGDSAITIPVGEVGPEVEKLLRVTRESLMLGIEQARAGNRTQDIGAAVQRHAEAHGYGVVRQFVGHGIGRELHERPEVPNYGKPGRGDRLVEGMVIAIEPMINMGGPDVYVKEDQWTAVTSDHSLSAHFEHSVAITSGEPRILGTTSRPAAVGL